MTSPQTHPTISLGKLALVPAVALATALARWLLQGSHNLYTDVGKRFYQSDPDLGWRLGDAGPLWLGLDLVAVTAIAGLAIIGVGWWLRRREPTRGPVIRRGLWLAATLPLLIPIAAFATGGRPAGARDLAPVQVAAAITAPTATASLDLPSGRYQVIEHDGTTVTARVGAGGETFEARFAGGIRGEWTGDPGNLGATMTAEFRVAAPGVDTGIDMRSKHAREYFRTEEFPEMTLSLQRVTAVEQVDPNRVHFTAEASFGFLGIAIPVTVTGSMKRLDPDARARLALAAPHAFTLQASFSLDLAVTPMAGDAGDFDNPVIPVVASLVLGIAAPTTTVGATITPRTQP